MSRVFFKNYFLTIDKIDGFHKINELRILRFVVSPRSHQQTKKQVHPRASVTKESQGPWDMLEHVSR